MLASAVVGGARPDRTTLLAFTLIVLIGGSNFVLVRFSNRELEPFWGAAVRFGTASLIAFAIVAARRAAFPRGRALVGALLYGTLVFGGVYALAYWGLQDAPAGAASILFASVPLLTLLLAVAHRIEPFRFAGLLGALLAIGGIGAMFLDSSSAGVPFASLVALLLAAVCAAESGVVVKLFPRADPFAGSAIGMASGAAVLVVSSLIAGEEWMIPTRASSWASVLFLIVLGGVVMFALFLYVLGRWTASATSYAFVLFPVVTVLLSAWLEDTQITLGVIAGILLVAGGVYIGALAPQRATAATSESQPLAVTEQD